VAWASARFVGLALRNIGEGEILRCAQNDGGTARAKANTTANSKAFEAGPSLRFGMTTKN
jgi:hypothetical protein